ncbi:MAG: sensor histidine kinase [Gammaproteobacteria bacterium]|nr:sensor histidine kinase [Gammaproteobacteria bacterium]
MMRLPTLPTHFRKSLKVRLATWLVVTLVILYVVQGLVVGVMMQNVTEEYVVKRLALDSELLMAGIDFDASGKMAFNNDRMPLVYRQPFSGHYYALWTDGQSLASRSLGGQALPVAQNTFIGERTEYINGPLNQHLLAYVRGYDSYGRKFRVAVAQDLSHLQREILDLYIYYIVISIAALVTLMVVQTFIVTRGLRPLDLVRQQLSELEHGEREHLAEEVPTEITPLVREINHLLDALALRLRRLRNATGNLAHALKTPLAVINRSLESADVAPKVRAELLPQVKIIADFIERELKRARLASTHSSKRGFAPNNELPALVQSLKAVYHDKSLVFDMEISGDEVCPLDREDMLELLGNLLDNAAKWARTRVRLAVSSNTELHLTVEDDGVGVADDLVEGLTLRGARADESTLGHGLGLAIVQDIVLNYQGRMRMGHSARLGGFAVNVTIPLRRVMRH